MLLSFGGVNPEQVVCTICVSLSEGWLIQYMTFINVQRYTFLHFQL